MSLSVATTRANPMGLTEYLVINGQGRLVEGGAPELLQHLAAVYLGPGERFPPMENPSPGYVLRITPESFGGVGPWVTARN